jgi:hypothetical protein
MSAVSDLLPRRAAPAPIPDDTSDRWVRRRVGLAWGLLVFNVLTYYPATWDGQPLAVPIPSVIGKGLTQAAMPAALLVALTVNRRIRVRPSLFLCLVSLLVAEALLTSMQAENFGTIYRTFRLLGFVVTLWLLSPWWGRRDLLLVRCHLIVICGILSSVVVGFFLLPGAAMDQGRLAGVLWSIPPTQVAHFAAVTVGLVAVLWLCGLASGRIALSIVVPATAILLLSHTRTALVAMLAGLLVAGLSLFIARARVRKLFAAASILVSIGAVTLSGVVTTWLARGENTQDLTKLTGRTDVWDGVLNIPRNKFQVTFGFGLTNKSFNGLPIDSNWLASYLDQGLFGVAICALMLLFLLVTAYFQPRGVQRALALFLVSYCLVASLTETGFTDATTYLLELTLAASLLTPMAVSRRAA